MQTESILLLHSDIYVLFTYMYVAKQVLVTKQTKFSWALILQTHCL